MPIKIRPFNVIDHTELPEVTVDNIPVNGDPLEIDTQLYFICEIKNQGTDGRQHVGVIPLVIKNTTKIKSMKSYLESLHVAMRRMQDQRGIQA